MPVNLGSHYLSMSAARKLLVAFNRTIKGTKDEPRTIRGISKMSAKEMEEKFKEFQTKKGIGKNKGKEILTHKRVKSKSYSQVIPKDTKRPKPKAGTKDAPSKTMPGKEDYTGKKGDIKKSAGKDVKKDNPEVDFEPKNPSSIGNKKKVPYAAKYTKKPKGKRKPSAYNKHIAKEMKAGKSMKEAAMSWRAGKKKK